MSQGILESPADLNEPVNPNDRFAYGWRYVKQIFADGSEKWKQVPLTLEDILHPQEEDFRVHDDPHWRDCKYLAGVYESALVQTRGAYVLGDCRVAWDAEGEYAHGPDIAVVFNVRAYGMWSTFNTVDEGTKPSLIVEITYPTTRSTDLVDKVREYAEQGVRHYVIADARYKDGARCINLIDNHLNSVTGQYEQTPVYQDGRVWLPEVNLWLGARAGQLVCYDATGSRKKTYVELQQELAKAKQCQVESEQGQVEAEQRGVEAKRGQVEAEQRRADAEKRAADLEDRVKELEDQLKRRNGEPNEGA